MVACIVTIAANNSAQGPDQVSASSDAASGRLLRPLLVVAALWWMAFVFALGIYAIFRVSHNEVRRAELAFFGWHWGAAGLGIACLAALLAFAAIRRLNRGDSAGAMVAMATCIIAGLALLGVRGMEWARWGGPQIVRLATEPSPAGEPQAIAPAGGKGDATAGAKAFGQTCASCHGPQANGIANTAPPLRTGDLLKQLDTQIQAIVVNGRAVGDPASKMGKAMPARGGNPFLSDADVLNIIAFLRSDVPATGSASGSGTVAVPRWVVPSGESAPAGLSTAFGSQATETPLPQQIASLMPGRSESKASVVFVSLCGVHALAVVIAMAVMAAALWLAYASPDSDACRQLARFGQASWLAVLVSWMVVLPLVYLL